MQRDWRHCYIKKCLVIVLELLACKYMNCKWWKLNPENSPDPDTITALTWPPHMLCSVLSAVTTNQAHSPEAIPALGKYWPSTCHRADVTCTLPVSAASGERGHVVLSILLKRISCFLSTSTLCCGSWRNTVNSNGTGTVIKRIISFLSSLQRDH